MSQKIEIDVLDGQKIGTFIISTDQEFSEYNGPCRKDTDIFGNTLRLFNINLDKFNNKNAIEFHKESPKGISIFLLEEHEYHISFKLDDSLDKNKLKSYFNFLKNKSQTSDLKFKPIETQGFLNFKSYAGTAFLDCDYDDTKVKIPIGVRSKKIDYENQYTTMLEDLSERVANLSFNINAPLQQNLTNKESKETYYDDLILLTYFFLDENLPSIMEYLSRNLYSLLESYRETVPTSLAANIGSDELIDMVSNPKELYESEEYAIFHVDGKGYVPLEIDEMKFRENINVPENRFYKYFLELLEFKISNLINIIDKDTDEYYQLIKYSDKINYALSQKFFKEISKMDYAPLNSQVLQKKEGYRSILKYFLMLESGFKISWNDFSKNFTAFQKELWKLYQYWVYFELVDILEDISNTKIDYESLINHDNWSVNLKESGKSLEFDYNDKIQISLAYQKTFSGGSSTKESYSVDLDPDYTISIKNKNSEDEKYLHFDAKYRAEESFKSKSYKNEDIVKMHAYKDGISNSIGAYVIYPGKNKDDGDIFNKFENKLGGVGAFSLNPGGDGTEREEISNFIKNIIKKLI